MERGITTEDVEELIVTSNRQIRDESLDFQRYLMDEIDWRDRLICIKGPRGTGKTTLMRQHIKEHFGEDSGLARLFSKWKRRRAIFRGGRRHMPSAA